MSYLTARAINKLNKLLRLPYRDGMQDWDIELADPARIEEFCDCYEQNLLDTEEKQALMALIIASCDTFLCISTDQIHQWSRVARLIKKDRELHEPTLNYWLCLDNGEKDSYEVDAECFRITPLIKQILNENE